MNEKPKPATVGEKIADSVVVNHYSERPRLARRIDAAIRRAVRKERERCAHVVFAAKCNCESFDWAHGWITDPENAAELDDTEREPER